MPMAIVRDLRWSLGKGPCHWSRHSLMFKKVQKDGPDFPAGKYLISIILIKNDENILKVNTLVIIGVL